MKKSNSETFRHIKDIKYMAGQLRTFCVDFVFIFVLHFIYSKPDASFITLFVHFVF